MDFKVQFASDTYAGVCPPALKYLLEANTGHDLPYGDDSWTREACNLFREIFETDCEVFFALTGTAANSLALSSMCESYHSIISHETGHIETDECGTLNFFPTVLKYYWQRGIMAS